jgi:2-amino-4-hydroxy-6-hydroxymethyldihydropteridine diphosphokinase
MARVTLSLGANLADKREAIQEAVERIEALPDTHITARSSDYRTPPWGRTDQDWFVNAALVLETALSPRALMDACLAIEVKMGRKREERWGPRRIDIDIITYDDVDMHEDHLTLPHPHALERAFVLVPLSEIAPRLVIAGTPISEALARLDRTEIQPLIDSDKVATLSFNRAFAEKSGILKRVSPLIRRIVAPNSGPFTFTGTCTYVIGHGRVAVLDPGPLDPGHIENIVASLQGEVIDHIVVTHTHKDHSPGAAVLKELTDAPIVGCAPHRTARALHPGETAGETGADRTYAPDHVLEDGEAIRGEGYTLTAVHTPGHTANHLCFALEEDNAFFSGDHVMAWSSTVVVPPDGSMRDYMASLDLLKQRPEPVFWPGHGGPVQQPQRFVRALHHHRRMREVSILNFLARGPAGIPAIVAGVYENLDPRLVGGAAMAVLAHLEDLVERGVVTADGPPTILAHYRSA